MSAVHQPLPLLSPTSSPLYKELEGILSRWLLWFRLRRAIHWAQSGIAFGLGIGFGLGAFLVWRGDWIRQEYLWGILIGSTTGLLVSGLAGFMWPTNRMQAARYFDLRFGLHERMSTALELVSDPGPRFTSSDVFQARQLEDTLASIRFVQPHRKLPLNLHRLQASVLVAILAGAILFYARGEPFFTQAAQQRTVQQAIQQQTANIEELRSQIEQNPKLTPEQRQALTKPLDEAIQKLQEAKSVEGAVSALNEAKQKLQALDDPQTGQMGQALQQAGNSLAQQEGSPLQATGQSLAQGNSQQAAQDLANVDLSQLTPEQSQALADQLEGMAESLQGTNPELASQLKKAAQALKNGDTQTAQQALQDASQALADAGQQVAGAQAARQAAGQLTQGQQQVIQAGEPGQGQVAQGQGSGQGQGNQGQGSGQGAGQGNQGQGSGAGQGSSNQAGQGGSSGGAGRGEGGGDTQPGGEAGNNPIQQGNGPGDAGERAYDPIYAPQHLGGSSDQNQVALPGADQPGNQITGQGNVAPGTASNSTVPYTQALPDYADAYRQAIESGQVPSDLRSLVKQYFISLQP